MEILGVIPARGQSKRLPGKNLKSLAGKPLILWSIEQAKQSKLLTRLLVCTEDAEIREICAPHCEVINRPNVLAQDDTPMTDVIQWLLNYLEKYQGYKPHFVVILQPTSPLRTAEDIDACIGVVTSNQADSLTTVRPDGSENGAVYVINRYYGQNGLLYGPNLCKWIMPEERSIDINTQEDFDKAEAYLDHQRVLHQLAQFGRGKGNDKDRPRRKPGRPRKVPTVRR